MMKNIIKTVVFMSITLSAEIDMQKGLYDAAEEMMAFDEKMNRLIAEHNGIDEEEYAEMHKNDIAIEDFEEIENGYQLIHTVTDANNTKVTVALVDGVLTIEIVTRKKELILNAVEGGVETTIESSKQSLFIPNDADEGSMESSYLNGILKILLHKSTK